MEAAIPVLKTNKNAQPQRDQWLAFRSKSSTKLYRLLSDKIRAKNPKCHLRLNDVFPWGGGEAIDYGMDLRALAPHLGSVVNQDHQEQLGRPDETFCKRKQWLATNRSLLGPDKPLLCGIAPRMRATPELVRAGIEVAL